ncbi:hypothetical protein [Streptomyces scabiei]|uniref:hypothetical protein n=1 Tax=Streptomyces scabiei TaxID=1930 RepID=UPI0029BAF87B|nr:hypothetical protein [Streptomyces scabiei]MDX3197858.1 hypothetical protein [Streptomyces scabiei]MDX3217693.1 hypothetical protein [Streptomyces scabiei]
MEQATQPTTPAAPTQAREPEPTGATLLEAHAVAGRIITQLATFPRDIDIKREFGGEYSVQIYWSSDVSGVAAFANWAKTPWHMNPSESGDAVYAEARSVIDNVKVWAWTLLTNDEAAAAEQLLTAPRIASLAAAVSDAEPEPAAVPLGESPASLGGSVAAQAPAVDTPTVTGEPSTIVFARVTPAAGGDR